MHEDYPDDESDYEVDRENLDKLFMLYDEAIHQTMGHLSAIRDNEHDLPVENLKSIAQKGITAADTILVQIADHLIDTGNMTEVQRKHILAMRNKTLSRMLPDEL